MHNIKKGRNKMVVKDMAANLEGGLDARKIALFVQLACQFDSDIYVEIDQKKANAKSIMGVISLGVGIGEVLKVSADGHDEEEALVSIERFLNEGTV